MVQLRDKKSAGNGEDNSQRLSSLDAVRGLFLLIMVGGGFGLKEMLRDPQWTWFTRQFSHSTWQGCTLWDLLCPAFLFLMGVAMPYSYANRQGQGHGWLRQFCHAVFRAAILIVLGIYLDSYLARPTPQWSVDLRGDLQQIGLAYLIAFLVLPLGTSVHGVSAAFLLVAHMAAHVIYASGAGYDLWSRDHNIGTAVDQWLRFAPREQLVTFNALANTAIVLFGVLISGLIRSGLTPGVKVAIMTACSLSAIMLGWTLSGGGGVTGEWFAIVPMIRQVTTSTFVLTSVGWTLLIFTYFYLPMDGFGVRAWAVPLVIVGRNSLIMYLTYKLCRGWADTSVKLFLPASEHALATWYFSLVAILVVAIYWLFCWWLYRRQIFFKV